MWAEVDDKNTLNLTLIQHLCKFRRFYLEIIYTNDIKHVLDLCVKSVCHKTHSHKHHFNIDNILTSQHTYL